MAPSCPDNGVYTPLTAWGDNQSYFLLPGASFENTTPAGWTLKGASVATGNESFYVNCASDSRSLSIPSGASATSAPQSLGFGTPTWRFFLKNTGTASATLRVEILTPGLTGELVALKVGTLQATADWSLSPSLYLPKDIVALLSSGTATVQFRFTAEGTGGKFAIDDVLIDPRVSY